VRVHRNAGCSLSIAASLSLTAFYLTYGIILKAIKNFTIFDVQVTVHRDKFL